ncbi:hypothetical protein NMY22_g1988 [Coprinellus aureogranulatus]|nr:hypothetical protein NMY22_g1988 [Coprinellus aureogranulatus]
MARITLNLRAIAILVFMTLGISGYIYYTYYRPPYALYDELFRNELKESQGMIRNKGEGRKYVKFKQLQGAGFNNQAQEILLFHHLALQTHRTYVYQPFIWRPRGENAQVPLSAFLRGVTRESISVAAFDEVCPESEVKHVRIRGVSYEGQWKHAKEVLGGEERCVVVDDWLFSWKELKKGQSYLASPGIHDIWPSYRKYLETHFEWSPQVLEIVDRTQADLGLQSNRSTKHDGSYMAVHLRRETLRLAPPPTHRVHNLGNPPPPLQLHPPPTADVNSPSSVYDALLPSLPRILRAITLHAASKPHLRRIHILHDGALDHPLVYLQYHKLRAALTHPQWAKRNGWQGGPMVQVTESRDVRVGRGEGEWKVCVDMEVAVRAEVFVGNGYSSLSSQIVALRLAREGGKGEGDVTFPEHPLSLTHSPSLASSRLVGEAHTAIRDDSSSRPVALDLLRTLVTLLSKAIANGGRVPGEQTRLSSAHSYLLLKA